jgi:hypothetical protein
MRIRGLLIAVVVLAALGGAVYWTNKSGDKADTSKASAESPKLIAIPEDQIQKIEIKRSGQEPVVLDKKSGAWELTGPKPLRADQDAAGSLVTTLSSITSDRLIEQKATDLAQYGLLVPMLDVTVTTKDGKKHEVQFGDDTPTASGVFAKLEGDSRVFTVATYTKSSLDKTANDLRDKRLLTFDSDKLTRIELIAKGQDIEFGKNNANEWQILKPRPMRADGGPVEELIRHLRDAKLDTSGTPEDARAAASGFASGTQIAIARVTDATGTQELTVRRDKDKTYYAKSSVVEGVYKINTDVGEGLDKSLADFQNKKLFDFGWSDPNKIEVRDGTKQVDYVRGGEKWFDNGKALDSPSIQDFIDRLRDLAASKFPEKGFSAPVIDLTVTSNDGKRVEKVSISQSGSDYIARRENEPTLYQLDANVIEGLRKALAAVKPAAPPAQKK